jgi:hypothetical protein
MAGVETMAPVAAGESNNIIIDFHLISNCTLF